MAYEIGAKDPKREVNLGKFGTIVFIVIFLAICVGVTWLFATKFLFTDENLTHYVRCSDGTTEAIEEGKYEYCGQYYGADTKDELRERILAQDPLASQLPEVIEFD